MINRNIQLKSIDINRVKKLTIFLARLGIESCIYREPGITFYGLELAEAKVYVENKYQYQTPTPEEIIAQPKIQIYAIKSVHRLMVLLEKFDLQEINTGLYFAKQYTINRPGYS